MSRKALYLLLAALCLVALPVAALADGTGEVPTGFTQSLEKVETVLYGGPQAGGLFDRLARAEKDLFGRELPGSLVERQNALVQFLDRGTQGQPGFLFKLSVAEWALFKKVSPERFAASRIESLEQVLEGSIQQGPLSMRLERMITKLLPGGVQSTLVTVPAGQVFKVNLLQPLSARYSKPGDRVKMELVEDLALNQVLVAPKGSRVMASVEKVEGPKTFGRPSNVKLSFQQLESLGSEAVPVVMGEASRKATELDKSLVGAAGASVAGLALFGPLGLAGGFLVRGDDKTVPAGTQFYLETAGEAQVFGYPIAKELSPLLNGGGNVKGTGGAGN
ncbi:MAG: hypothetical protein N2315_06335 [Thermanaerothrix sp.]|nr:hypothetical protein [Thermanaerothrix sp.]